MKLTLIFLLYFFTLGLSAQDSLIFEFSDSAFLMGQEKVINLRFEYCAPFGSSEWNLTVFDSLEKFMQTNQGIEVSITNHTDSRGTSDSNQKLSELRTKAIQAELVSRGISENRIQAIGKGESEPIHSEQEINKFRESNRNKFEQLHQINRRTILRIIHT